MAVLPDAVKSTAEYQMLCAHLEEFARGKVRDTFVIDDKRLFIYASNRISVFDNVLPFHVPKKRDVLVALTDFWLRGPLAELGGIENHLIESGARIDDHLPVELRNQRAFHEGGMIVSRQEMWMFEAVVRGWLTGGGWKEYAKSGTLHGEKLPEGLQDGSKLDQPAFTPTDRGQVTGHDEPIPVTEVVRLYGQQVIDDALLIYRTIRDFCAAKGIIFVDTKMEWKLRMLCDEVGTPDSSRFWLASEYDEYQARGQVPPAYDKQFMREWAKFLGIHLLNSAKSADDLAKLNAIVTPEEVIEQTTQLYLMIFELIVGMSLAEYQRTRMGILA